MKVAICASYEMGDRLIAEALTGDNQIDLVATFAGDQTPYAASIADRAVRRGVECARAVRVNDQTFIDLLRSREIDLVLLLWWPEIVKRPAIDAARVGWVSLHTSWLPFNRGMHPYYWAIVEGTKFGVSLHFLDDGIDTGPVLFQKEIPIEFTDTGASVYRRLTDTCVQLFAESCAKLLSGDYSPEPQDHSVATFHRARDIESHSAIDLDRRYTGRELIDILRARTFPGRPSAYCHHDGKKYWLRLQVEEVEG